LALRCENYSSGTKDFIGLLRHAFITRFIFIKLTTAALKTVYLGEN